MSINKPATLLKTNMDTKKKPAKIAGFSKFLLCVENN